MREAMRVLPASMAPYGAQIPTVVVNPLPREKVGMSVWVKAISSPLVVEVHEFRAGAPNRYIFRRALSVGQVWRHVSMTRRVRGHWLGLGLSIVSLTASIDSSFAVRGLTISVS